MSFYRIGVLLLLSAAVAIAQNNNRGRGGTGNGNANLYAAAAMLPALLWTIRAGTQVPLLITRAGVLCAVMTGLAFGVFAGILFFLFSQGVNLSMGAPIIRLGGMAVAAFLGIVILHEPFSLQSLIGFVIATLGILLIALR